MDRLVKSVAVAAALIATGAQAGTVDLATTTDVASIATLAETEFTTALTLAADGNVALIGQSGSEGQAYILQTSTSATNFAAIVQATDAPIGVVIQSGTSNRAYIVQ